MSCPNDTAGEDEVISATPQTGLLIFEADISCKLVPMKHGKMQTF